MIVTNTLVAYRCAFSQWVRIIVVLTGYQELFHLKTYKYGSHQTFSVETTKDELEKIVLDDQGKFNSVLQSGKDDAS